MSFWKFVRGTKLDSTNIYNSREPFGNTLQRHTVAQYQAGIGGCFNVFTPNDGYWCGHHGCFY